MKEMAVSFLSQTFFINAFVFLPLKEKTKEECIWLQMARQKVRYVSLRDVLYPAYIL